MVNFGVIGYGYWGPNIVRNLIGLEGTRVLGIADKLAVARERAQKANPGVQATAHASDVISSSEIDAVAIITPVWTHFELAKAALENGKHIFVEKPFTSTSAQAEELIDLASRKHLKIMVDHTFLFTGAVKKIKQLLQESMLGKLYYYDSTRVNLGLFQHDIDVIWDLAPHDLAIMDYLIRKEPEAVVATGQAHLNSHADIAFITVYFPQNTIAHINVNWLSPVKVRTTLIGGEKKMLVWNDLEPDEKIKIYDKVVKVKTKEGQYNLLVDYRSGDMWAPKVEQTEALKLMAEKFVDYVKNGGTVVNDGIAGLNNVKMLEAANKSLNNKGKITYI